MARLEVSRVRSLLEIARPDAAVLDVNLRGERVTPVAEVLQAMRVPFLLASGYGEADFRDDPVLAAAPNLGKPTCGSGLLKALNAFWPGIA